jgi:hypothetical protein
MLFRIKMSPYEDGYLELAQEPNQPEEIYLTDMDLNRVYPGELKTTQVFNEREYTELQSKYSAYLPELDLKHDERFVISE